MGKGSLGQVAGFLVWKPKLRCITGNLVSLLASLNSRNEPPNLRAPEKEEKKKGKEEKSRPCSWTEGGRYVLSVSPGSVAVLLPAQR